MHNIFLLLLRDVPCMKLGYTVLSSIHFYERLGGEGGWGDEKQKNTMEKTENPLQTETESNLLNQVRMLIWSSNYIMYLW